MSNFDQQHSSDVNKQLYFSFIEAQKAREDISALQAQFATLEVITKKLDTTIEKISDIANSLAKLVAVHETRLETQEKMIEQFGKSITQRNLDLEQHSKYVYDRLQDHEDKMENKIIDKLGKLEDRMVENHQEVHSRISKLERMFWMGIGALTALSTLATIVTAFFG